MQIGYLDALDETGHACQVQLDERAADRERLRGMFSVTDAPRAGCPQRSRTDYGWKPTKREDV